MHVSEIRVNQIRVNQGLGVNQITEIIKYTVYAPSNQCAYEKKVRCNVSFSFLFASIIITKVYWRSDKLEMIFSSWRFFQKTNEQIWLYYLWTCFCSFFGRKWRHQKIHFEIDWPLVEHNRYLFLKNEVLVDFNIPLGCKNNTIYSITHFWIWFEHNSASSKFVKDNMRWI